MRVVLMWSLLADAACILLVFLLVVLLSRRAIDPVVRSAQQQKKDSGDLKKVCGYCNRHTSCAVQDVGYKIWPSDH